MFRHLQINDEHRFFFEDFVICSDFSCMVLTDDIDGKEFVIISSRSVQRSKEACDEICVTPLRIINCRVLSRAEEMLYVDSLYPMRRTIYIGDMQTDKNEALRAGWGFMFPDEFIKSCE
jgi:hypothetical protein